MYDNLRGSKILYIEDDEVIAIHFKAILQKLGANVSYASDYYDGIKFFEKNEFDTIITDIRLPGGTGIDIIKFIRMINRSVPIIVTSGYAETSYLLDAIEYDVARYFIKPFKETELFDFVDKLMLTKKSLPDNLNLTQVVDGFSYSFSAKAVIYSGVEIKLSSQEIYLIELLLRKRGSIVGYDEIQIELSKTDSKITIDTLRTVVKNIRKKTSEELILTQSGMGYKIV